MKKKLESWSPWQGRQGRFGPSVDFEFQYTLIRNKRLNNFGVEYWTLHCSNHNGVRAMRRTTGTRLGRGNEANAECTMFRGNTVLLLLALPVVYRRKTTTASALQSSMTPRLGDTRFIVTTGNLQVRTSVWA